MPIAYCLLPIAYCLLPIAYCVAVAYILAYCLLPVACCLLPLPIAYCLLPIAYCLLPIAYCLLPIAYCLCLAGCIRRPGCILPPNAYCFRMHTASECIRPPNAFGGRCIRRPARPGAGGGASIRDVMQGAHIQRCMKSCLAACTLCMFQRNSGHLPCGKMVIASRMRTRWQ